MSLILLLLAVLGCTPAPTPQSTTVEPAPLLVQAHDIAYEQTVLTATVGLPVVLHFENLGALAHDFSVDSIMVSLPTDNQGSKEHQHAPSGEAHASPAASLQSLHFHLEQAETGRFTFTPQEPGVYDFYCSEPGHREAGMVGKLIVEATDATP